jgi:hypothetical protein
MNWARVTSGDVNLKADDKLKGIPVIFISALTEQLDR